MVDAHILQVHARLGGNGEEAGQLPWFVLQPHHDGRHSGGCLAVLPWQPAVAGVAPLEHGGYLRLIASADGVGSTRKVAGDSRDALSHVLPSVAGVVAELGGSTSHLASLARERGIPMVLGVLDATARIPDGSTVAVDGVAGVVRWMH